MGRSSRRYLQPQTPRRAALGPAELPKFGPASACRAAAPSPAVPGRAKPSPAVPSRSGVPRAPPAAQRPDTEGTGGRKEGRKEGKKEGAAPKGSQGKAFLGARGAGGVCRVPGSCRVRCRSGTEKPPRRRSPTGLTSFPQNAPSPD